MARLIAKWVPKAGVLYYGLAGSKGSRPITDRLTDLLHHAAGATNDRGPHKGGEILWQVRGYLAFSVWALATDEPPVPRQTEVALLQAFLKRYNRLPFANRQP